MIGELTGTVPQCVVFVIFFRHGARRYSIGYRWVYLLALVTVGLSLALPLFLYARERHLPDKPLS